jgi:hypothetical protein
MDKNKLIDEILAEWAMRSPDGLAGGHDTPENVAVLNELMREHNITELTMGDWGVTDKLSKVKKGRPTTLPVPRSDFYRTGKDGKTYVVGHKNYANWTSLDAIKANDPKVIFYTQAQKDKLELDNELRAERIRASVFEDMKAKNGKAIPEESVDEIEKVLRAANVLKYATSIYNTKTVEEAIEIYNTNSGEQKRFVDAMNSVKHMGLGRGELAFVFMLKDVKSGGTGDVDLLNVEGYGAVEVKEVDGVRQKESIRISSSTLHGFSNSVLKNAIESLAHTLRKRQDFGEFLLKVLNGRDKETNELLFPGARQPSEEEYSMFEEFVKSPNTADMPKGIFRCLVIIAVKLELPIKKKNKGAGVSISINDNITDFKIDSKNVAAQIDAIMNGFKKNPAKPQKISFDVFPVETGTDESYKNMALDQKFFDSEYTLATISDEIVGLLVDKYKAILVVSAKGVNKAQLISTDTIELTFDGMAQNMLMCSVETKLE